MTQLITCKHQNYKDKLKDPNALWVYIMKRKVYDLLLDQNLCFKSPFGLTILQVKSEFLNKIVNQKKEKKKSPLKKMAIWKRGKIHIL
jgi:hypothetical protein